MQKSSCLSLLTGLAFIHFFCPGVTEFCTVSFCPKMVDFSLCKVCNTRSCVNCCFHPNTQCSTETKCELERDQRDNHSFIWERRVQLDSFLSSSNRAAHLNQNILKNRLWPSAVIKLNKLKCIVNVHSAFIHTQKHTRSALYCMSVLRSASNALKILSTSASL